jgi:hypothetical protein
MSPAIGLEGGYSSNSSIAGGSRSESQDGFVDLRLILQAAELKTIQSLQPLDCTDLR